MAIAVGIRHVGQRAAHLALDGIWAQERLGIHRVKVVHAVEERGLEPAGAQGAGDDIQDDRAAKAADVDRPRWGLGVIDDLRSLDACRQLVSPVHGCSPFRCRRAAGSA